MNYKHGDARKNAVNPLFNVWRTMLSRCTNPNGRYYHRYGGRGISVCDEWSTYTPFKEWAESHGYINGLTLERVNNDKGYSPDNCIFATRRQQARNRASSVYITHEGLRMTLAEAAERHGLAIQTLWARLNKLHWPVQKALGTPPPHSL